MPMLEDRPAFIGEAAGPEMEKIGRVGPRSTADPAPQDRPDAPFSCSLPSSPPAVPDREILSGRAVRPVYLSSGRLPGSPNG